MEGIVAELLKTAGSAENNDSSVNFVTRNFDNAADAARHFELVTRKLFDIKEWSKSSTPSEYAVFDASGAEQPHRPLAEGDFIRILLHGSGKYDWVRLIEIHEGARETVFKVKPTYDPTAKDVDTSVISHFLSGEAENNFCVALDRNTVGFYVIGLREKQNTDRSGGIVESARNVAAANLGYYLGIQKSVWKEFCTNMLQSDGRDIDE